ncbi:MAG: hypothetical protein JNL60_12920, partial [Bacteroidia bacterium]|nr:hypothetical protein [Bacteroidia bacterium]
NLSQNDIKELIDKKLEKEANRYIQQWPEEKIAIENGRWGPFVRFGKNMLKLIKEEGGRYAPEELTGLSLEEVKKMIETQMPGAFDKKGAKGAKKAAAKASTTLSLTGTKKAAPKKSAVIKKIVASKGSATGAKKASVKKAAAKKAAPRKAAAKKKKK